MTQQENIVTLTQTEGIATLIARLRKEESRCASVYIIDAAIETIERLVNERDTARRMYCVMAAQHMYKSDNKCTAEHIANNMNWDCYTNYTSQEQAQGDIK